MQIRRLDPHDEPEAAAWYAALRAGASAGRTAPLVIGERELLTSLRTGDANPNQDRHAYGAWDGDACLGTLLVTLPLRENRHAAEVDVNVPPAHRRRGVGAALYDRGVEIARTAGRTTLTDGIDVPTGGTLAEHPGGRFALARGFAGTHSEQHMVLDLPLPEARRADLAARAAATSAGYTASTWLGVVPPERAGDLAALLNRMAIDIPIGESSREPAVFDAARVTGSQERHIQQGYDLLTTLVADADGAPAAYSLMFLTSDRLDVLQSDTFVLERHRGHRLGTVAKLANLGALAAHHPGVRYAHTWTAEVNGAMHAVNARFGFRAVETTHEVEATL